MNTTLTLARDLGLEHGELVGDLACTTVAGGAPSAVDVGFGVGSSERCLLRTPYEAVAQHAAA